MNQPLPEATEWDARDLFAPVRPHLEQVERILQETIASDRPGISDLTRYLENYRGKRLRPALLLLTAEACGGVRPQHPILAAVVEMIHNATLVHDDVLDSADTRRHVATINTVWGNQASILLGDYLFTHAFHLTSTLGDATACEVIGRATNRVCEGELHQICRRGRIDLSEAEYLEIIDAKTAELTSCCCRLGAMYAGADEQAIEALADYGRWLGVAFQIADDLLDLIGREEATGKSLGTDVEQQKLTLPLIHLLATASNRDEVAHVLSNGKDGKRQLLRPFLEKSGSIDYARNRAAEFADRAAQKLRVLPDTPSRDLLYRITRQVVDRDR